MMLPVQDSGFSPSHSLISTLPQPKQAGGAPNLVRPVSPDPLTEISTAHSLLGGDWYHSPGADPQQANGCRVLSIAPEPAAAAPDRARGLALV